MTVRVPRRGVPVWRRIVGILLIFYGIAGIALLAVGASLVAGEVGRLDSLTSTIDTQRGVLVRSLDELGTFLNDAQTGTGNVKTSLTATVDSARQVAALTRSLADAMAQLSSASSFNILGSQPFAGLTGTFSSVADKAGSLGASLDHTADALATNGADLGHVHDDIATIQAQLDDLRRELSGSGTASADVGSVTHTLETLRLVLLGLLVWLGLQGVIAIAVGIALATHAGSGPVVAVGPGGVPVDDVI